MSWRGRVLILGSAPDVLRARDWSRSGFEGIVAINNAWKVRPDWDFHIHPSDLPEGRRPTTLRSGQVRIGHERYVPAVNHHGGFVFAGGTMAFTAAYWALQALRPRLVAFLGCDMIYDDAASSHFYGKGHPDPLRSDPTLQSLEAKAARFQLVAAAADCAAINLSERPSSRLVFPRMAVEKMRAWTMADASRYCAELLTPPVLAKMAEAREIEKRLGYAVPNGKYWKELDRFDPAALRLVDELWLAAVRSYWVAA